MTELNDDIDTRAVFFLNKALGITIMNFMVIIENKRFKSFFMISYNIELKFQYHNRQL